MSKLSTIYFQYVKNYYRSRSFYLMLFLIAVISVMMTYFSLRYVNDLPRFLGSTELPPALKETLFYFLWAFVLAEIPVFASVFFGSPALSSEIENRTAYYIFPLPINRYKLYIGKYLAAITVTLIIMAIYLIFEIGTLGFLFKNLPPVSFYYSLVLLVLFILSIMSITFMISAIFNKNTYAYISVFVIYYIVFEAGSLIIELLYKVTPTYLLNEAATIIERVYMNINTTDFLAKPSISPAPFSDVVLAALIIIIYLVVSFVIGMLLFERKEVS